MTGAKDSMTRRYIMQMSPPFLFPSSNRSQRAYTTSPPLRWEYGGWWYDIIWSMIARSMSKRLALNSWTELKVFIVMKSGFCIDSEMMIPIYILGNDTRPLMASKCRLIVGLSRLDAPSASPKSGKMLASYITTYWHIQGLSNLRPELNYIYYKSLRPGLNWPDLRAVQFRAALNLARSKYCHPWI